MSDSESKPIDLDSDSKSMDVDSDSDKKIDMEVDEPVKIAALSDQEVEDITKLKEEGNALFKANSLDLALEKYGEGKVRVLPEDIDNTRMYEFEDDRRQALFLSFSLNLAQVNVKLSDWDNVIYHCREAFKVDENNVKALYRLGLAQQSLKNFESAKQTFGRVMELDSTNKAAHLAYKQVQKEIKSKYSNMFAGKSMYEHKHREAELQKQEWANVNKDRVEKGKKELTYEEWMKRKEKEAEKAKKEEKKQREKTKATTSISKDNECEIDEEDEKILAEVKKKGYCYFKTDADPNVKLDIQPKKISQDDELVKTTSTGSAWNQGGTTWEDKEMSSWAEENLKKRIRKMKTVDGDDCNVTDVKLKGDATISIIRGTRRFLYDYNVEFKFNLRDTEGSFKCPEVSDHNVEDPVVSTKGSKTDVADLKEAFNQVVREFFQDFQQQ